MNVRDGIDQLQQVTIATADKQIALSLQGLLASSKINDSAEKYLEASSLRFQEGNFSEAEHLLCQAMVLLIYDRRAMTLAAKIFQGTERNLLAYQTYAEVAKRFVEDTNSLESMAWISFFTGRMSLCLSHIEDAFNRGVPPYHHLLIWASDAAKRIGAFDRLYALLGKCPAADFYENILAGAKREEHVWNSALRLLASSGSLYPSLDDVEKKLSEGDQGLAAALFKLLLLDPDRSKSDLMAMSRMAHRLPDGSELSVCCVALAFDKFPSDSDVLLAYASKLSMRGALAEAGRILVQILPSMIVPDEALRLMVFAAAFGQVSERELSNAIFQAWGRVKDPTVIQYCLAFSGNLALSRREPQQDHLLTSGTFYRSSRRASSIQQARPRLAVCISGQLRSFRKNWPVTRRALRGWDAVVFLSTWEASGVGEGAHDSIDRLLPEALVQRLHSGLRTKTFFSQNFPTCLSYMSGNEIVSESMLKDYFQSDHVIVNNEAKFEAAYSSVAGLRHNGNLNQAKMFFCISQANQLRRDHSLGNFDLVLRLRPDKAIIELAGADVDMILGTKILCTDYLLPGGVGDQAILSSPEIADCYSMIWDKLVEHGNAKFFPGSSGRFNEFLMAEWLASNGTKFSRYRHSKFAPLNSVGIEPLELWEGVVVDLEGGIKSSDQIQVARAIYEIISKTLPDDDLQRLRLKLNDDLRVIACA